MPDLSRKREWERPSLPGSRLASESGAHGVNPDAPPLKERARVGTGGRDFDPLSLQGARLGYMVKFFLTAVQSLRLPRAHITPTLCGEVLRMRTTNLVTVLTALMLAADVARGNAA